MTLGHIRFRKIPDNLVNTDIFLKKNAINYIFTYLFFDLVLQYCKSVKRPFKSNEIKDKHLSIFRFWTLLKSPNLVPSSTTGVPDSCVLLGKVSQ